MVIVGTAVALFATLANRAGADAPEEQGWWTLTNQSAGLPVSAPVGLPNPPDVPPDGLLVQSGPSGPLAPCACVAIAAVVYELPSGSIASELTLKVAPNSATTPVATLDLCALTTTTISSEQGGPMADAPDYDCSKKVTAALDTGGTTFKFSVAKLASNNSLAVAIVPGDSNTRVALSKPDASSLTTTAGLSSSSFNPAPPPTTGGTGSTDTGSAGGTQPAPPALPAQPVVGGADSSGQSPVVASAPSTPAASSLQTSPVAATTPAGNSSTPVAVIVLIAGLALGAALWMSAGRAPTEAVTD